MVRGLALLLHDNPSLSWLLVLLLPFIFGCALGLSGLGGKAERGADYWEPTTVTGASDHAEQLAILVKDSRWAEVHRGIAQRAQIKPAPTGEGLDLQLLAIINRAGGRYALVQTRPPKGRKGEAVVKEPSKISLGGTLEGDWLVDSIEQSSITLVRGEESRKLRLYQVDP